MSYILDALKKSDQERQSQEGPTLQTIHRPIRSGSRSSLLLVFVAAIGVVVLAVAGVYFWSENQAKVQPAEAGSMAIKQQQLPSAQMSDSAPATAEQEFTEVKPADTAVSEAGPTVAFSELPDNIRNEIPALTFSFHVYSESPANRTIIINKRRVKEGDEVVQGLRLKEITPEGVVLDWKGRRFFINVVENW